MGVFTVGRQVALEIDMPGWWLANASVDMDFRRGLYYDSSTANPRAATDFLSCVRASNGYAKTAEGTLTQFANNILRVSSNGLLVEDARTNLNLQSQDFSTTWGKTAVTVSTDAIAAPDATITADKLVETAATTNHYSDQAVSGGAIASGTVVTTSIYVKAGERTTGVLANSPEATRWFAAAFDLSAGTITSTNAGANSTLTASGIEALANGWYRIWITGSHNSTLAHFTAINLSNTTPATISSFGQSDSYLGDITKGFYVWGAQVESGAFSSSYIPTSGAAATRAADSIAATGNLLTVVNATTASLLIENAAGILATVAATILYHKDGIFNDYAYKSANTKVLLQHNAVTIETTLGGGTNWTDNTVKSGFAWSGAGGSVVANGGTVVSDAGITLPAGSAFNLDSATLSSSIYGYYRRLTVWNSKLADATLQALTAP